MASSSSSSLARRPPPPPPPPTMVGGAAHSFTTAAAPPPSHDAPMTTITSAVPASAAPPAGTVSSSAAAVAVEDKEADHHPRRARRYGNGILSFHERLTFARVRRTSTVDASCRHNDDGSSSCCSYWWPAVLFTGGYAEVIRCLDSSSSANCADDKRTKARLALLSYKQSQSSLQQRSAASASTTKTTTVVHLLGTSPPMYVPLTTTTHTGGGRGGGTGSATAACALRDEGISFLDDNDGGDGNNRDDGGGGKDENSGGGGDNGRKAAIQVVDTADFYDKLFVLRAAADKAASASSTTSSAVLVSSSKNETPKSQQQQQRQRWGANFLRALDLTMGYLELDVGGVGGVGDCGVLTTAAAAAAITPQASSSTDATPSSSAAPPSDPSSAAGNGALVAVGGGAPVVGGTAAAPAPALAAAAGTKEERRDVHGEDEASDAAKRPRKNAFAAATSNDNIGNKEAKQAQQSTTPATPATANKERAPPTLHSPIDSTDPWAVAWSKMRSSGWTWKNGTGLMTEYYYVKPNRSVKHGIQGEDYFISEKECQVYAQRHYGWHGDGELESDDVGEDGDGDAMEGEENRASGRSRRPTRKRPAATLSTSAMKKIMTPFAAAQGGGNGRASRSSNGGSSLRAVRRRITDAQYLKSSSSAAAAAVRGGRTPHTKKNASSSSAAQGKRVLKASPPTTEERRRAAPPSSSSKEKNNKKAVQSKKASKSVAASAKKKKGKRKRSTAAAPLRPGESTPPDCKTRPQDPGAPLLSSGSSSSSSYFSARSSSSSSSSGDESRYEWKYLWDRLRQAGWRVMPAGRINVLHDWYYVRPGRDPTIQHANAAPQSGEGEDAHQPCILGEDYFLTPADVIDYQRRMDQEDDAASRSSARSGRGRRHRGGARGKGDGGAKKAERSSRSYSAVLGDFDREARVNQGTPGKKKRASTSVASSPSGGAASRRKGNMRVDDNCWWKVSPIPSFAKQVWPLMQTKLHVRYSGAYYILPGARTPKQGGRLGVDYFESSDDLRRYLCRVGIPNMDACSDEEKDLVRRWVSFANVPIYNEHSSMDILKAIPCLSSEQAWDVLSVKLGYRFSDGTYQVPVSTGGRRRSFEMKCFPSLESLREFVRWHGLESHEGKARSYDKALLDEDDYTLSDEDRVLLAFWAAASKLPTHPSLLHKSGEGEEKSSGSPPCNTRKDKVAEGNIDLEEGRENCAITREAKGVATPSTGQTPSRAVVTVQKSVVSNNSALTPAGGVPANKNNFMGTPIQKEEEWLNVWDKMKYNGWYYTKGQGVVDFYFMFPGGAPPREGGILGKDYYTSWEEVKAHAVKHYGWGGE